MKVKKGIGVAEGYAIAPVRIVDDDYISIPTRYIKKEMIEKEIDSFDNARAAVVKEINKKVKNFPAILKEESLSIIDSYTKILYDKLFSKEVKELIRTNLYSASYAVFNVLKKYINALENAQDEIFRSRAHDIIGLRNLLIKKLSEQQKETSILPKQKYIIVAKRFNLASTINALLKDLTGIISEEGTKTSHAAILAKEFGIPAVTGIENLTSEIIDGEQVIIDGFNGTIILSPTEEAIKKYEVLINLYQEEKRKILENVKSMPCRTSDGIRIKIYANIEFPEEIQNALDLGAEGIGLFRTEFSLQINNGKLPTFEELFNKYKSISEQHPDIDVVFRLFDVGGDKLFPNLYAKHSNPFLGVRGIRIYNIVPELFINQVKAILMLPLRKIKILVPMVSSAEEILTLKKLCFDTMNDVKKIRINDNFKFQIGIMLEIPSAILAIDEFAKEVDFFSIGTNDLIQYTLAIDRTNNDVAYLYQPLHKSILKLIQLAVNFCEKNNKELAVCGEIANDPVYASLLIGMGIKNLSVAPSSIPNLKKTICSIKYEQVKQLVKKVLQFEKPQDAYKFLEDQLGFYTTKPQ